jgi:hypothetical protein
MAKSGDYIPITWKTVSGPSNASANALLSKSGEQLGAAIEGLGTNVGQYADDKQKRETDEFIAELGALPDDAARQDALKQAETGWMNLDRINTATTDLQAGDYTTAASARAQILGDIDVKTQVRGEESRVKTDEILSNPDLTATGLNEAALQLTQGGWKDHGGRLKARANEIARNTDTGITEDFIQTQIADPTNEKLYTRATYNTIVNNAYNKLKEDHPYADESVLKQRAKEAITRTEAGTLFERQQWFEELERPGVAAEEERVRKKDVVQTWRTNKADISTSHSTYLDSQKALAKSEEALKQNPNDPKLQEQTRAVQEQTRTARADFRAKLSSLSEQFDRDSATLGKGAATKLTSWTQKAIVDYTQNDLQPIDSYIKGFQRTGIDKETGEEFAIPLGLSDYSPTKQSQFIDQEVKKLMLELPHADEAAVRQSVVTKIKSTALGVKFAQGALPSKLQAAADRAEYETAENRFIQRSKILKGIKNNNSSIADFAYKTVFDRLSKEEKAGFDNKKLSDELSKTVKQWKSFIPNWTKLGIQNPAARDTYKVAMYEILAGVKIDKDWLYFDEDDFAISEVNKTGDISGITKNEALMAIMGRINPAGNDGNNQQLISLLEKTVEENNAKAAKLKHSNQPGFVDLTGTGQDFRKTQVPPKAPRSLQKTTQ